MIDAKVTEWKEERTMQPSDLDDLLTVEEVAAYLKVPKSWVYERTRFRAIPVRKIGRHCRIPREEFLEWVNQQTEANSGEKEEDR